MANPNFLAGETLSAATLQKLGVDDTYTPELTASITNPNLGSSPTQEGLIWLNGMKVDIWFTFIFGTGSSAGSGNYHVALPSAYPFFSIRDHSIGTARCLDNSLFAETQANVIASGPNNYVEFRLTTVASIAVGNANPFIWADTDVLHGHFTYLTDFGV